MLLDGSEPSSSFCVFIAETSSPPCGFPIQMSGGQTRSAQHASAPDQGPVNSGCVWGCGHTGALTGPAPSCCKPQTRRVVPAFVTPLKAPDSSRGAAEGSWVGCLGRPLVLMPSRPPAASPGDLSSTGGSGHPSGKLVEVCQLCLRLPPRARCRPSTWPCPRHLRGPVHLLGCGSGAPTKLACIEQTHYIPSL